MGTERQTMTVHFSVSRHNSPRDQIHDALASLLAAEINALVKDSKYEAIQPELDGEGYL